MPADDVPMFQFTTFTNSQDNVPRYRGLPWPDFVKRMMEHKERENKEGSLWSPTIYKGREKRSNNGVEWMTAGVGDFDHGATYEEVVRHFAGYEYIAHSTHSHRLEEPRFRIIIPFAKPVAPEDWPKIKPRIDEHVFGLANDPGTKDLARIYYLPSCHPDAPRFSKYHEGQFLDAYSLPPCSDSSKEQAALTPITPKPTMPEGDVKIQLGRTALDFVANGAPVREQRRRAVAAARNYLSAGYSIADTAAALWRGLQASPQESGKKPWRYEDALKIANDLATKPAPPLAPLPDYPPIEGLEGMDVPLYRREAKTEKRPLTDTGNAERLVELFGEDLRYCPSWSQWLHWNGRRWERTDIGTLQALAKLTSRSILQEAANEPDDDRRKALVKHERGSESERARKAMINLAQSEPSIVIQVEELDRDPFLLNVLNGTIDLTTGKLRPHNRQDLITRLVPVLYDPEAKSPLWESTLQIATGEDEELITFLQRAIGYSLTGDTSEEKLFFVHGPEAAVKSTFVETIKAMMGDYAKTADFEAFLARRDTGSPRPDIARLAGSRVVISTEVDEGKKLAEGVVKMLTGGDTVTARELYQKAFEFKPQFKLWLCANHAPTVNDEDGAMWRRILRVPFEHTIPKEKRDPNVKAQLRSPLIGGPAVLTWAVQGCLDWQRYGLGVPPIVERATEKLRTSMDPLADFIEDCCELNPNEWTAAGELREVYERWCRERGEKEVLKGRAFGSRLKSHGCKSDSVTLGKTIRIWWGIAMRSGSEQVADKAAAVEDF